MVCTGVMLKAFPLNSAHFKCKNKEIKKKNKKKSGEPQLKKHSYDKTAQEKKFE